MTFRSSSSKHIDIRIASLAAGLALATAAVIGGSDLLGESGSSNSTSSITPSVERVAPQFSTQVDAVFAAQAIRAPSQFATMADAVHASLSMVTGQEAASAVAVTPNNLGDHLGIGQPGEGISTEPMFSSMADADFASR